MYTGSSTELVNFKQKERPSEDETLHPLVTFHSSFNSSVFDGSRTAGVSKMSRGNWPGDVPRARAIGLRSPTELLILGVYGLLLITVFGMCVGLV